MTNRATRLDLELDHAACGYKAEEPAYQGAFRNGVRKGNSNGNRRTFKVVPVLAEICPRLFSSDRKSSSKQNGASSICTAAHEKYFQRA